MIDWKDTRAVAEAVAKADELCERCMSAFCRECQGCRFGSKFRPRKAGWK